jgi:hypothetical protein
MHVSEITIKKTGNKRKTRKKVGTSKASPEKFEQY